MFHYGGPPRPMNDHERRKFQEKIMKKKTELLRKVKELFYPDKSILEQVQEEDKGV